MLPLLLHHFSPIVLALAFLIMSCRPRALAVLIDSVTRLVIVLVCLIARDDQKSRVERAIDLWALRGGREWERRSDRRALPPGSSP